MNRALLAATLVALAAGHADAALLINEVFINPPSTDAPKEYVELRNTDTAAALTIPAGTYFVGIEGDGNSIGDVQTIFDVSGLVIPPGGYLVLLQGGHTYTTVANATVIAGTATGFAGVAGFVADSGTDIENESVTFLLLSAPAAPTLTTDIDANDDGIGDGAVFPTWTVLDSIGILNAGATSRSYASLTFGRMGGATGPGIVSLPFIAGYVARNGNSTGSAEADWVAAEVLVATAPATGFILSNVIDTASMLPRVSPAAYAGLPLDHVGGANFLNDAPVLTAPASPITLVEDASQLFGTATSNAITIADIDAGTASLTVTLTAAPGTVTLPSTMAVTVTGGMNGTSTITFTGTVANVNTALDGVAYYAGDNVNGTGTLTLTVNDGGNTGAGGAQIDTEVITFTISAVNDAPTVIVPGAQVVQVNGMIAFSTANATAISVADLDLGAGTLTVTAGGGSGTVTATAAGAAVVTNSGTSTLTIVGTLADVNATLQALVYTAPATTADAVLAVTANDGMANGLGIVNITVTGAPFLTAPAGPFDFTAPLGGTSPTQTLMVMAGALGSTITVTTTAPFEVAAAAAGPFALTASLPATGGMLFVHYEPTAGTDHAATITYAASGVTSPPPTTLNGQVFRITTASLPQGTEGEAYMATATAAGGASPVTWSLQAGAPAWLLISSAGVLSGTPTADGTFSVTLVATDDADQTATLTLQLVIEAAVLLDSPVDAPAGTPDGTVPVDARPDAPGGTPVEDGDDGGCCSSTTNPGAAWLLGLGVVVVLARRRRRVA